jgi:type I restriction enzyme R subunit
MLETGVNVPEAVNLVFMRPVQSRIKLEQMIGRGTRSHATCQHAEWLPDGRKTEFLVIDFWDNEFSKRPQEQVAQSLPVLVTIFNTQLLLSDQGSTEAQRVIADLRAQIDLIPTDSFSVRQLYPQIEQAWDDAFWRYITPDMLTFLKLKVGPLLRYAPSGDVQAATFTSKVERLKLHILTGQDASDTALSIAEDVSRLKHDFIRGDPGREAAFELCLSPGLRRASVVELNQVIDTLAELMSKRSRRPSDFLELDLADLIDVRGYILLYGGSQPVYVEEYRRRVDERILDLVAGHPTIEAIEHGEAVSDEQLIDLERTLRYELGNGGLELSEANIRKAYGLKVGSLLEFLRRLLEIETIPDYQDIVRRQFGEYIARHPFNADQARFLRAVENVVLQRHRLKAADLYDPPFTSFGRDAVERLFSEQQISEMLSFTESLVIDST